MVKGLREGFGIFVDPSGNRYEGMWKNNCRNGRAKFFYSTGEQCEGVCHSVSPF